MVPADFDEYEIAIKNLEKLRLSLNIEMQEIDEQAKLGTNTYSRIVAGKQPIKLNELIAIGRAIYSLKAVQILNPNVKIPSINRLPIEIKKIAKERQGKDPRIQEKRDIIYYCILILNKHFKAGDDFTNSQIKGYLNDDLKFVFKGKSIEWNKSIIAKYIFDTETTRPAKTKPENVYKLLKKLPVKMVNEAKEIVGEDWLEDIGEE